MEIYILDRKELQLQNKINEKIHMEVYSLFYEFHMDLLNHLNECSKDANHSLSLFQNNNFTKLLIAVAYISNRTMPGYETFSVSISLEGGCFTCKRLM